MKRSRKLIDQINSAPEELREYIHDMETWDHTECGNELFALREQVRAQGRLLTTLRERLRRAGLPTGFLPRPK